MKIEVAICPHCKENIYSRARHDYISCSCRTTSVDGGHYNQKKNIWSFERLISNFIKDTKIKTISLPITDKQLYDDWNYGNDKYGRIKK